MARQVWLAHRPGRRWDQIAVLARTNAQLRRSPTHSSRGRIPHQRSRIGLRAREATSGGARVRREPTDDAASEAARGRRRRRPRPRSTGPRASSGPPSSWSGSSEGLVPMRSARTAAALAEERRLLYVALTRAEDDLCVHAGPSTPPEADGRASPLAVALAGGGRRAPCASSTTRSPTRPNRGRRSAGRASGGLGVGSIYGRLVSQPRPLVAGPPPRRPRSGGDRRAAGRAPRASARPHRNARSTPTTPTTRP